MWAKSKFGKGMCIIAVVLLFVTLTPAGRAPSIKYTIEKSLEMPTMQNIQISDVNPQMNQAVTVTLIGTPNENTNSQIKEFEVDLYYGLPHQVSHYIYEDTRFSATGNKATFTFTPSQAGHITIEAFCVDYEGRQSEEMTKGMDVSSYEKPKTPESKTPGFEMVALLVAMGIVLWMKRKK